MSHARPARLPLAARPVARRRGTPVATRLGAMTTRIPATARR